MKSSSSPSISQTKKDTELYVTTGKTLCLPNFYINAGKINQDKPAMVWKLTATAS